MWPCHLSLFFSPLGSCSLPPFHVVLSQRKSLFTAPREGEGLCSTSLRGKYPHKLFRILLNGRLVYSYHVFIYPIIYFYQYGIMNFLLYFGLYLFCCLNCSSFGSFSWLLCPLISPHCFVFPIAFLYAGTTRGCGLILNTSCPQPKSQAFL